MTASTPTSAFGASYGGPAPENYQRYFVPAVGAPLANHLVSTARLRSGERVLDVACGTGVVTRLAAERVGSTGTVAGLDVNPGMLAVARTVPAPAGAAIRWYETSAEAIPLPDAAFDVVLCQMGLQFMADKGVALREMRRVLAQDGRMFVTVPTPSPLFDRLDAILGRHVPRAAGFVRQVFSLHDPAEIERLLRDAGLNDVTVRIAPTPLTLPSPGEFLWQYVSSTPLAGMVPQRQEPAGSVLEGEVVAAWQPWVSDGVMRHELGMLTASGRR